MPVIHMFDSFEALLRRELLLDVEIGRTTSMDSLGLDSLGYLELAALLYEHGAELDDAALAGVGTVGELYDLYVISAAEPPDRVETA